MTLVNVGMGDLVVSCRNGDVLAAILGSCVGVIMLDRAAGVAGLAHVMLPLPVGDPRDNVFPARYADSGVPALLSRMLEKGAEHGRVRVKICGGAAMFKTKHMADIGARNVTAVRVAVMSLGIPVEAESTGGGRGRRVLVDVGTCTARIRYGAGGVKP